jgi:hypothetical protein
MVADGKTKKFGHSLIEYNEDLYGWNTHTIKMDGIKGYVMGF